LAARPAGEESSRTLLAVEDFFGQLAAQMPGGRNITPEQVAAAVTFLASDDASGINGIDLPVDAGVGQI
jgi:NAD(P)-dependent dehydrogenase (short-subunit alcohol dehydrogenase family)